MPSLEHRLTILEVQSEQDKKARQECESRLHKVERRLSYYDKLTLKWTTFIMTVIGMGAMMSMGFDSVKEKIISMVIRP